MSIAHLDIIAEDIVESYFQTRNIVFGTQSLLHLEQIVLARIGNLAQFVEFGIDTLTDHRTLAKLHRRLWLNLMIDALADDVAGIDLFANRTKLVKVGILTLSLNVLQSRKRNTQLDNLARIGTTHSHLAYDTLHVAHLMQALLYHLGHIRIAEEIFNNVESLTNTLGMYEWEEQPSVHQSATHRSSGIVDDIEQRTSALVHGADKFETSHGETVETHIRLIVNATDASDMTDVLMLSRVEIAQDSTSRSDGKRHLLNAKTLQVLCLEKLQQTSHGIVVTEI